MMYQQLQAKQHLQMFKVTVHTHVSSTRPPDLLATGRACTKSTATKRQGTAQPIGCEDKEIHGSPRGAVNGKQGRLPDKSQKHRRGVLLKDSQDEVSDVCSPLVQLQQAAEAQNALSTNKRQRSRYVAGILSGVSYPSVAQWCVILFDHKLLIGLLAHTLVEYLYCGAQAQRRCASSKLVQVPSLPQGG